MLYSVWNIYNNHRARAQKQSVILKFHEKACIFSFTFIFFLKFAYFHFDVFVWSFFPEKKKHQSMEFMQHKDYWILLFSTENPPGYLET